MAQDKLLQGVIAELEAVVTLIKRLKLLYTNLADYIQEHVGADMYIYKEIAGITTDDVERKEDTASNIVTAKAKIKSIKRTNNEVNDKIFEAIKYIQRYITDITAEENIDDDTKKQVQESIRLMCRDLDLTEEQQQYFNTEYFTNTGEKSIGEFKKIFYDLVNTKGYQLKAANIYLKQLQMSSAIMSIQQLIMDKSLDRKTQNIITEQLKCLKEIQDAIDIMKDYNWLTEDQIESLNIKDFYDTIQLTAFNNTIKTLQNKYEVTEPGNIFKQMLQAIEEWIYKHLCGQNMRKQIQLKQALQQNKYFGAMLEAIPKDSDTKKIDITTIVHHINEAIADSDEGILEEKDQKKWQTLLTLSTISSIGVK